MNRKEPLLEIGAKGEEVEELQVYLRKLDFNLKPDGDFGESTLKAVLDFQSRAGLFADGIVGQRTWDALKESLKSGEIIQQGPLENDINTSQQIINDPTQTPPEQSTPTPTPASTPDSELNAETENFTNSSDPSQLDPTLSLSVAGLENRFGRSLITSFEIIRELIDSHSDYLPEDKRSDFLFLTPPEKLPRKLVKTWISLSKKLLKPELFSEVEYFHGKLFILCLTELDPPVKQLLTDNGILQLLNNITPPFVSLLRNQKKTQPDPINKYEIEKILHNDQWAEKDLLDYRLYAQTIKSIITQKDHKTKPPLTIAILAPWGQGKTTLMRYIQEEFKPDDDNHDEELKVVEDEGLDQEIVELEKEQNKEQNNISDDIKSKTKLKELLEWSENDNDKPKALEYPTVWFNPWKYQNSEQVWAGTAHAIITDLVSHLNKKEQEKFWFKLNLKRLDLNKFKRDIYKSALTQILAGKTILNSIIFFAIPLIILFCLVKFIPDLDKIYKFLISIVSLLGLSLPSVFKYISGLNSDLNDKLANVIREPNYDKKQGYFHEVEDDMLKVFDLIVDENKPAIIFIDDLDRCSPDNIVEVIEAINLIINSRFSNKCYFVIGMDAQMVAASLDQKYTSLVGKFQMEEKRYGSIGWYFLDKFIQLPLYIPVLSPEKKKDLLSDLFKGKKEEPRKKQLDEKDRQVIIDYVNDKANTKKKIDAKEKIMEKPELRELFIEESIKNDKDDTKDIMKQLERFSPYLGTSPRSIKRFANMFRFNNTYQNIRDLEDKPHADQDSLSKWIVILLRYPQLVRFIQWEKEDKIINSKNPEDKAERLDEMVEIFNKEINSKIEDPENLTKWKKEIEDKKLEGFEWLKEGDLIKILILFNNNDNSLIKAIKSNVW